MMAFDGRAGHPGREGRYSRHRRPYSGVFPPRPGAVHTDRRRRKPRRRDRLRAQPPERGARSQAPCHGRSRRLPRCRSGWPRHGLPRPLRRRRRRWLRRLRRSRASGRWRRARTSTSRSRSSRPGRRSRRMLPPRPSRSPLPRSPRSSRSTPGEDLFVETAGELLAAADGFAPAPVEPKLARPKPAPAMAPAAIAVRKFEPIEVADELYVGVAYELNRRNDGINVPLGRRRQVEAAREEAGASGPRAQPSGQADRRGGLCLGQRPHRSGPGHGQRSERPGQVA